MSSFSNINGNNTSRSLVLPQGTYLVTFGSMPPVAIAQVPVMPQPLAFPFGSITPTTINVIPQAVDEDDNDESSLQLTEQGRANHIMGEVPKLLPRRRRRSKRKTIPQDGINSAAWTEPELVAQPNVPHHNNFFALTESDEERPRRIYARRARNMPRFPQPTHLPDKSGRPKSDNPTKTIRQVYRTVNTNPQWHLKRQRATAQETVSRETQVGESQPPRVPVASRLTFPKTPVTGRTVPQTFPRKSVFERLGPQTRTPKKSLMITAPISSQKKRRKAMQVEFYSVYNVEMEDTPESPVEHHTVYMVLPSEGIEEPVGPRTRQQKAKSIGAIYQQQPGPSASGAQQVDPQVEQISNDPIAEDSGGEGGSAGLGEEHPTTLEAQVAWLTQQLKDQQQRFSEYRLRSEQEKMELMRQSQETGARENLEKSKGKSVVDPLIVEDPHPNSSTNKDMREEKLTFTKKELQDMISQQLQAAGVAPMIPISKRSGRPYPAFYDAVPYPKGYIVPRFKTFSGESLKGTNPEEHLAHFQASCGNTANNDALLLR